MNTAYRLNLILRLYQPKGDIERNLPHIDFHDVEDMSTLWRQAERVFDKTSPGDMYGLHIY